MAATSQDGEVDCKRSRKCSKLRGHKGLCNSEKELGAFWEKSPIFISNKRKRNQLAEEKCMVEEIREYESTTSRLRAQVEELNNAKSELEIKLKEKGKLINITINVNIPFDFMPPRNCCTLPRFHKICVLVYQHIYIIYIIVVVFVPI